MTELKREVKGDKLFIHYDSGEIKEVDLPKAPNDVRVDKEYDEELVSGHTFTEEAQ